MNDNVDYSLVSHNLCFYLEKISKRLSDIDEKFELISKYMCENTKTMHVLADNIKRIKNV